MVFPGQVAFSVPLTLLNEAARAILTFQCNLPGHLPPLNPLPSLFPSHPSCQCEGSLIRCR